MSPFFPWLSVAQIPLAAAIVGQNIALLSIAEFVSKSKNNKRIVFVIYFVNTYNLCGSGIISGEEIRSYEFVLHLYLPAHGCNPAVRALFPTQFRQ